ncbi:MAG: electron transfer flavoprotein subunit alpha/FixB family protein [Deltaproteobacteria bacterium]|nr:MAG: electron transfer flavoprotein subunit alpha/FixB family protein [Deltaproteobacteria bacterium]
MPCPPQRGGRCSMSVWVVAEHRNGAMREVTYELLSHGAALGLGPVTALVFSGPGDGSALAASLDGKAPRTLIVEDSSLLGFNGTAQAAALATLISQSTEPPKVILGAHSAAGMDWAPTLAGKLACPAVTDVVALAAEGASLAATRVVYGGKLNSKVKLGEGPSVIATIRPGSLEEEPSLTPMTTTIETANADIPAELGKRFVAWVEELAGAVDISQADILVSVGRGIQDKENIDVAEALAEALGATLSCSRPVVDINWLPKER